MIIDAKAGKAGDSGTDASRIRLLRFIVGDARIASRRGDVCVIVDSRERKLEIPSDLVEVAIRDGLLEQRENGLSLRHEGRAFLKRCLSRKGLEQQHDFAAQHGTMITIGGHAGGEGPRYNLSESPLAGLSRLKGKDGALFLDEASVVAGERLRADFTRGQLQPRITANWEAVVARGPRGARNGAADLSDSALAARMRVDGAVKAIGPDLGGVVLDVCCFLKGLETVERERQWPARSGKLMLRTGLRSLARHYGLMR